METLARLFVIVVIVIPPCAIFAYGVIMAALKLLGFTQ
jgi:hypothetical protein